MIIDLHQFTPFSIPHYHIIFQAILKTATHAVQIITVGHRQFSGSEGHVSSHFQHQFDTTSSQEHMLPMHAFNTSTVAVNKKFTFRLRFYGVQALR